MRLRLLFSVILLIVLQVPSLARKKQDAQATPSFMFLESEKKPEDQIRGLSSGNAEDDFQHYRSIERRFGFDLGMMIPMGDFQKVLTKSIVGVVGFACLTMYY